MRKRERLDGGGRPWLLGDNDTPPPLRVPWQMWSKSSDPHQQGLVAFEFTEEGLAVGWYPEGLLEKQIIPWHELAWMANGTRLDLQREIEFLKEEAQTEGYKLGMKQALMDINSKLAKYLEVAKETENPFLAKYAGTLKQAIAELKTVLGCAEVPK